MKFFRKSKSLTSALISDYKALKKSGETTNSRFLLASKDYYPINNEKTLQTNFDRHYIYHTAWAARVVRDINPDKHIDISSALYFASIISTYTSIEFYDFRPPNLELDNLKCSSVNLTDLSFEDNSIKSLSCMHVVEHVGLGRYGDPIDYDGDLKAINELQRVVKKGGNLLFVVPIGGEARICFNAHRIYTYKLVMQMFDLNLKEFSLIPANPKNGHLIRNATEEMANNENYGCGCFWFTKE